VKNDDLEYEQYDDEMDASNNFKAVRKAGTKEWKQV